MSKNTKDTRCEELITEITIQRNIDLFKKLKQQSMDAINDAAEKYANENYEIVRNVHEYNNDNDLTNGFIDGAKSDAAKEYWYAQFKAERNPFHVLVENDASEYYKDDKEEQKQLTDEEIEKLAVQQYELATPDWFGNGLQSKFVKAFIRGYKAAINFSL
jgi:hypothetical protein